MRTEHQCVNIKRNKYKEGRAVKVVIIPAMLVMPVLVAATPIPGEVEADTEHV